MVWWFQFQVANSVIFSAILLGCFDSMALDRSLFSAKPLISALSLAYDMCCCSGCSVISPPLNSSVVEQAHGRFS